MKTWSGIPRIGIAALLACGVSDSLFAQDPSVEQQASRKLYNPPPVFLADSVMGMTVHAPFSKLRRDRQAETEYRRGFVTYTDGDADVRVVLRARTRGVWRKANCEIPPLLLNFVNDSAKKTLFARSDRLRLSMHCRNTDDYEQYVLQEYQLYRVQRLLTPLTFAVRLARVTYVDSEKGDTVATRWGFLQEQDDAFTERTGVKLVGQKGAGPADLDPYESAFFGVFQYFVGNSDFSIRELHNVVLVFREPHHIPVARDFDWSGAVNARYAKPNPVLPIRSVTDRIMRGYCAPPEEYEKVFKLFRDQKDAIYALYRDEIGQLLRPNVVASTLRFFDAFYATINDPKKAQRDIIGACLGGSA
ncbi:MAG TPA: hypothetical protein VEB19_09820 [Gemmatimonadaceae bacterium]|nr:hypothetical protein [Gemmatimonadaceae bacterium]